MGMVAGLIAVAVANEQVIAQPQGDSSAALREGAFTVGSLVGGHHWSFWMALIVGTAFAAAGGVLVGIPALRLSGLFLAILTVAVALFFDRFLLAPGTWNAFSGGVEPWRPARPSIAGISLDGSYAFYLFVLAVFLLTSLVVWNLRRGKVGRVLRAIRGSELAAATVGLDLTAWKLAAFGVSAGLAGLAGGLSAVAVGSVSAGSYDFLHSVSVAAVAIVMGVGITEMAPGSQQGVQVVVSDVAAARQHLLDHGVAVSGVDEQPWGLFVRFTDPDGNGWVLQQIPGRG